VKPLKTEMRSNFSLVSELQSDWIEITGGQLAASHHGCGTIVSGESLYFHEVSSYTYSMLYHDAAVSVALLQRFWTLKSLLQISAGNSYC